MIASGNAIQLWWVLSIAMLPECAVLVSVLLHRGKPHEKCPLCQTRYLPEFKGIVCKICQVCLWCSFCFNGIHAQYTYAHAHHHQSQFTFCCSVLFGWQRWAEMVLAFASVLSSSDSNSVLLFLVMTSLPVCTMTLSL